MRRLRRRENDALVASGLSLFVAGLLMFFVPSWWTGAAVAGVGLFVLVAFTGAPDG